MLLDRVTRFANELQHYFTHGDSYTEALTNGQEVLALLIESYKAEGKQLPQPQIVPPNFDATYLNALVVGE